MKQIIVFGMQRSGTTALERILGRMEGLKHAGEIFHSVRGAKDDPDFHKYLVEPNYNFFNFKEQSIISEPSLCYPSIDNQRKLWIDYTRHLNKQSENARWVIGIKYNSTHHLNGVWHDAHSAPLLFQFLSEMDATFLHVIRNNLFQQAISQIRSERIGQWHAASSKEASSRKISYDPYYIESLMVRSEYLIQHARMILGLFNNSIEIEYESLFENNNISPNARTKISSLTGLNLDVMPKADLRKFTDGPLKNHIKNHQVIRSHFSRTKWQRMVEESFI